MYRFVVIFAVACFVGGLASSENEAPKNIENVHSVKIRDVGNEPGNLYARTHGQSSGNGRFFGSAMSSFSSTSNDNGHVRHEGGALEEINDNGQITRRFFNI